MEFWMMFLDCTGLFRSKMLLSDPCLLTFLFAGSVNFLYCVICTGVICWRISHFRMLFTHMNECWKETNDLAKLLQLLDNMKSIHPLKFALKVKHFTHVWDSVNEMKLKLRLLPFSVVHIWCQHAFCFQFYHIFHSLTWNKYCHVLTAWPALLGDCQFHFIIIIYDRVLCQLKRSLCKGMWFLFQTDWHRFKTSLSVFLQPSMPNMIYSQTRHHQLRQVQGSGFERTKVLSDKWTPESANRH